jgi:hypothetical protein
LVWRFSLERASGKCGGAKGIRTPDLLHAILKTLRTDV